MIKTYTFYCKQLYQEIYNKFIETLNFSSLTCSACDFRGGCQRHAFYKRTIKTEDGKKDIRILRVKYSHCHATHALLPNWIVPYSHHLIVDQIEIIRAFESGTTPHQITPSNPEINIWSIIHIIKQYQYHWQERLLAMKDSVFDDVDQLIQACFTSYNRQFTQIKRNRNMLLFPTT